MVQALLLPSHQSNHLIDLDVNGPRGDSHVVCMCMDRQQEWSHGLCVHGIGQWSRGLGVHSMLSGNVWVCM